ncbi:MAG: hypothetical protein NT091_00650, partial [Candidatus Falkowbacteria bacterium]|nr:hypothetical protein [Candidatus Falkowbacteria bacterium]
MLLKKTQIVPTLFASSIFFVYLAYTVHAEYYYNSDLIDSLNNDVKQINNNISDKKKRIDSAKDIQSKYVVELTKKQNEKATLQNELALLDNRIAKINLDIEELKMNVELTQLEIQKTQSFIEIKNTEIDKTENNLRTIIQSLNKEGDTNLVEILLLNENLSDFLSKAKYLEDINKGIDTTLKDLMKAKTELEVEKNKLAVKTEELESFKTDLLNSLDSVDQEKKNKEFILEETKNSEEEYQNLIQVAKNEQDAAQRDILNLEQTIRQKLSQIEKNKIQFNDNGFIWPVPKNTITAYFHDPGYPFRYVFEHPA